MLLNRLLNRDIVYGTMGNGFERTDIMFPFICAFVNKATGYTEYGELRETGRWYFDLLADIYCKHQSGQERCNECIMSLRKLVKELKE